MQPGLNGSKGPDNSLKNTAIFDTMSWYWANHFPIVPSDYATNLLKIRLSDDVLQLAQDNSRDGEFFKMKAQLDEHWAWWVFPSFSQSYEKYDFDKPENIESGRCISRLILCSPEYINAYTKIIEYVANEIDNYRNNRAELESRFEKNVDFFKMLQCILNLYSNIPVVCDKCETAQVQLLVKFCDALKKFSDSMKAITSCKLRYGPEINKKNDINIKYIKALNEHDEKLKLQYLKEIPRPTIFLGLQDKSLEGYMRKIELMKVRIFGAHMDRYSRKVSGSLEPFPEINKKFFGKERIRNDYHYLIIKYYDEYLKNGGKKDIDAFLESKGNKARWFYSCVGFDKIKAYNRVDAPSLLCFFNRASPDHRLNMIKECIEMEKKYDPPRTDIMSILIYEYLKTVKQEYIKELPYKGQLYIIKDFFPGTQVKNQYKRVEDNLITAILTKISEQLNNNNFDKLANRNNLLSSVISKEDMPFHKNLTKYKQVDEEKNITNTPIQKPERRRQKEITQNPQNQPQIKISFPVRKRYQDLMMEYHEMYPYPNADNIYEWINEANDDARSVYNKWTNAKNTAKSVRNNLPLKNFIKPHQLVCFLNNTPHAKDRLYIIKDLLFFSEHIVDPELMAIIVNEYYSITRNAQKLYDLDALLKYYLGGEIKIDPLFGYNTEEKIKAEMLEIKDILDKTDIENSHINDDDVANFEANKKALFDDNELRECHRRHHPPRQEHINLFEGGENIRKDLYFPIKKEFMLLWNLREQNDKIKKSFADIRNIGMFVKKMAKTMDKFFNTSIEKLIHSFIKNIEIEEKNLIPIAAPLLCWFNNTKDRQSRLEMIRKCCEVVKIIKFKINQKQTPKSSKEQYAKFLATIVHEYYVINNIQPSEQLQRCFDNYFGNGDLIIAVFMPTDHLIAVYEKEIEKINAELNKDKIKKNNTPTINDHNTSNKKNDETQKPKNDETTKEKNIPPINIPATRRKKPTPIIPRRKRKKYTYRPKREAQKNKKEINRIARGVLQFFIDNKNPNRRLNLLRAMIKNDEIDKNIYTPLIVCLYCYTLKNPQLKTMKDITHEIVKDSNLYGFGEPSVNYESKPVRKVIQYMEIIKKNFDTFSNKQILAGMTCIQDDLTPNEGDFQQKENKNIVNNYDINNLNLFDKNGKIMFKNLGDLNEFFSEEENHAWEKDEDKSFNLLEDIKRHQISINSRINFVEHSVVYHIYNCRALYCWFEKHTDPEERLNVIRKIYNCLERKSYQEKKEYKNMYDFISYMFLTTLNDGDPRSITALNAMMEIIQKGDKITEKDAKRAIKIKERIIKELKEKTNDELISQPRIPRIEQPNNKTNKNFLDKKRILSNNRQEKLANAIQNGLLEIQKQPNRHVKNKETLKNLVNYAKLIRQAITT